MRLNEELRNLNPEMRNALEQAMDEMEGAIPVEELKKQLTRTAKGQIKNSRTNCTKVFRHDPALRKKIRYNILAQRVDIIGTVPWSRSAGSETLTNSDLRSMHLYIEQTYGLTSEKYMDEAMYLVADENQYHPVRDFLNQLHWDGTPRIQFALHHFLGADTSEVTGEMLRLFMLGAISRVFTPGIKFDYMLCLVGGQGIGKSTFFRFLTCRDEWFCDDLKNLESETVYQKMQGHWIIELSEMIATNNARTNEAVKSFLSRQKETFRTPYDRLPEDRPRQCVFAGTTNKMTFLPNDRSGNRRFLPVLCHEKEAEVFILDDEAASRAYIDQMWAEVMEIYRSGKFKLKLSRSMTDEVTSRQKQFLPEDADAGLILSFLQETTEEKVCSKLLFREALKNGMVQPQRWQTNEICEIVNQLIQSGRLVGWKAFDTPKRFGKYGTQRGWERIKTPSAEPSTERENVNEPPIMIDGFVELTDSDPLPF